MYPENVSRKPQFHLSLSHLKAVWFTSLIAVSLILILVIALPARAQPSVIYVDHDATGANDGSSWGDAYTDLQGALAVAHSGDEIWVATGVYTPGLNVSDTFNVPPGVALYGGFAGGESSLAKRDWEANLTVLSGDLYSDDVTDARGVVTDTANIQGTNAIHVVLMDGTDGTIITGSTRLDGFIITGGYANGSIWPDEIGGGGLYCNAEGLGSECSPFLTNLIFEANYAISWGGGMMNYGDAGKSNPILNNITFRNNYADYSGGAMYNLGDNGGVSRPTLTDVTFIGNRAETWIGGAVFNAIRNNAGGALTLTNVIFHDNHVATYSGGALAIEFLDGGYGSATLNNVAFYNNSAFRNGGAVHVADYTRNNPVVLNNVVFYNNQTDYAGGGIDLYRGQVDLTNSILWGNTGGQIATSASSLETITISHSLLEGGLGGITGSSNVIDGGGNLDANPRFVDAALGDLRLRRDSPAVDAGSGAALPPELTTDLAGVPRVADGDGDSVSIVDMGAYETMPAVVYVDADASGTRTGFSWTDALTTIQDALPYSFPNDNEIWVATGVYTPGSRVRDAFDVPTGAAFYGGFAATETARTQRDWVANPTVLSGDIDGDDVTDARGVVIATSGINGANAYHVLSLNGTVRPITESTRLDGFIVTAGDAQGTGADTSGGGLSCNGEGVGSACSPTLANLVFSGNRAQDLGGALLLSGNVPATAVNGLFYNNEPHHIAYRPGAPGNAPHFINSTFYGATAHAVHVDGWDGSQTPADFTNVIFWNNNGDMTNVDAGMDVQHSVVEESVFAGGSNLDVDPLFVDAAGGDLRPLDTSPAVEIGDPSVLPADVTTDLAGGPRILDYDNDGVPLVDAGAYESSYLCPDGPQLHVDVNAAAPRGSGWSWTDAFVDLHRALVHGDRCYPVEELWVATGVYTPGGSADDTFSIPPGLALYGGFAATETARDQRDWVANPTVLSGDIDGNDVTDTQGVITDTAGIQGDNSHHVLLLDGTTTPITTSTRLDGFIVTGGQTTGGSFSTGGGGLYCNGAGGVCSPSLVNLLFTGNTADNGGAIFNFGSSSGASSPVLTNVAFRGNAAAVSGGAIFNMGIFGTSSPVLTNVTFNDNYAADEGGAMTSQGFLGNAYPHLTNAILWGNSAGGAGDALYNDNAHLTLTNSLLEGGLGAIAGAGGSVTDGGGNLDGDPLFVDAASGNLRLQQDSPAIDTGDSGALIAATDLDGFTRIVGGAVDMGAYESQYEQHCGLDAGSGAYTLGVGQPITLTIDAPGDLACVTVTYFPTSHPMANSLIETGAFWSLSGTDGSGNAVTSGFTATLTLPHTQADGTSRLCRYPGEMGGYGWDCDDGGNTTFEPGVSVTRANIHRFSDWTVGQGVGPTSITLRAFGVTAQPNILWVLGGILALGFTTLVLQRKSTL